MILRRLPTSVAIAALQCWAGSLALAQPNASGWTIERTSSADLWFHTLAIIGLEGPGGVQLYDSDYADRIATVKSERVVSTNLDELAVDLRGALEQDGAFQALHNVPLYFASVSLDQMLAALDAIVLEGYGYDALDDQARAGFDVVSPSLRSPRQRRVLRVLLDVLRDEWDNFYSDYWDETAASSAATVDAIREQWVSEIAPALRGFLQIQQLETGTILLSPALHPRGRLYIHSSGPVNAATGWLPTDERNIPRALFSIVRELCSTLVGEAVRGPSIDGTQEVWENATVRCGAMLVEDDPEMATAYRETFLLATGARLDESFDETFPIDDELEASLRAATAGDLTVVGTEPLGLPTTGWAFRPTATTDLWFHVLAVIAADQPGPLGMYSADYANHIRDVKRDYGVYPTRLDSLTARLNDLATGGSLDAEVIHFVPVYFPDKTVDDMLNVLRSRGHTDLVQAIGRQPDAFTLDALGQLADAAQHEWEVFYRDYWARNLAENQDRYDAVQAYWNQALGPVLTPYLEERRLQGGLVMPSMPVGPEGRIINPDPYDWRDQVIAMEFPLTANTPEVSNFFFLKELCFLIIDDQAYGRFGPRGQALDDLRRTGAVRCGAMILDELSPVLALQYRRTFLDAVGAEESATIEAFDRVYYLDPSVMARIRAQVTMPR